MEDILKPCNEVVTDGQDTNDLSPSKKPDRSSLIEGSILVKDETPSISDRCDRYGKSIKGSNKGHRISFKDKIGNGTLTEEFLVESYKKYYKTERAEVSSCSCRIV